MHNDNRPGVYLRDRTSVEEGLADSELMVIGLFLPAAAPLSEDWLFALPISSCGSIFYSPQFEFVTLSHIGLNYNI